MFYSVTLLMTFAPPSPHTHTHAHSLSQQQPRQKYTILLSLIVQSNMIFSSRLLSRIETLVAAVVSDSFATPTRLTPRMPLLL